MSQPMTSLRGLLEADKAVTCAWCTLGDPSVAAFLAREPYVPCVALDMQHGTFDFARVCQAIALIHAAGKPSLVRIPVQDYASASRMLDAGAAGIVAPMIEGPADARALVAFAKYPPVGARSWGPQAALAISGRAPADYLAQANRELVVWAMVETRGALDQIDAILAVDGIDGVFIGPSDLSISLSGGQLNPSAAEVEEAIDLALARAHAAGKLAGIFAPNGERAREFAALGYDLVTVGTDVAFLKAGAAAMMAAASA